MDCDFRQSQLQLLLEVLAPFATHSTVRCTVVELNFGERVRMMRNNGMRIVDQDERGEMAKGSITRQSLSGMKIDLVRALVSRSAICLLVST